MIGGKFCEKCVNYVIMLYNCTVFTIEIGFKYVLHPLQNL